MKLSKRFSTLKKSLGLTFIASCIFAYVSCNNMASIPTPTMTATVSKNLTAPVFPILTDENGNPLAVSSQYEQFYTVTQGQKKKISLSWLPVDVARYYEIYYAADINDTFKKAGETTKTSFDDSVSSGKNYFYKVCAVNSKGERSDFSSIARGSTLATPAITSINVDDTSATITWYMSNAAAETYAKKLIYELHASFGSDEKVFTVRGWDESSSSLLNSYTFNNLGGNREYSFQVIAYTTSDQNKTESSPKVTKRTLAQYIPTSPEFSASQGVSVSDIKLSIKLPPKVTVETNSMAVDYPLCFEIQRKKQSDSEWKTVLPCLYCDGKTTAPDSTTPYDNYTEGTVIEWKDQVGNGSNSVLQAVKYDYRIISVIDTNYSTLNNYDFTSTVTSNKDSANTATGWAADFPTFKAKRGTPDVDPHTNKNTKVPVTFEVTWNDLGKAQDYRFAIEQNRKKFKEDNNGEIDTTGVSSWVKNINTNEVLLNTLEAVNALTTTYDFTSVPPALPGIYTYTLYIVPIIYENTEDIKTAPLTTKTATNIITISKSSTEPKNAITAEGGWKDKIKLTWEVENEVSYFIKWKKIKDGQDKGSGTIIEQDLKNQQGNYTGEFFHQGLEGGCEYQYNLYANEKPGETKIAYTLGTPIINFDANSYTDITVTWAPVVAAEQGYDVKLGASSNPKTFGDGIEFTVKLNEVQENGITKLKAILENQPEGVSVSAKYVEDEKTIKLTISKPYGWNDATLSGKAAPLTVKAISAKETSENTKDVWTIGPAASELKATETYEVDNNKVKITWKELKGAKGYAVYRLCPELTGNTDVTGTVIKTPASLDVYYVTLESGGAKLTCPSGTGNAVSTYNNGTFTLTDTYKYAGEGADSFAQDQQRLALGVPFTYTIIPVLKSDDVDIYISNPSEWKIAGQTGQTYNKLANVEKKGYTIGYGIALEATKAEYGDKVVLTWEPPQSAKDNFYLPTVYYRKKDSDKSASWTKLKTITLKYEYDADGQPTTPIIADTTTITRNIDRVQALEYAITYDDSMESSTGSGGANGKDVAFAEYQRSLKNNSQAEKVKEGMELEPKCVGYMFTMPQIMPEKQDGSVDSPESKTETVQWYFYDKEGKRAIGGKDITEYTLELKNLNCSDKYYKIYTYNANGGNPTEGYQDWYDTVFTTITNGKQVTVTVTPSTNTFHDGLLKVLRDYKHYYRISAKRTNSQGETITATSEDYAYRKITETERNSCVGLICADAFYQMGMPSAEGVTITAEETSRRIMGNPGVLTVTHTAWHNTITWGTTAYSHVFPRTPGDQTTALTSAFSISIPTVTGEKLDGHTLRKLPATTITINHECGLPSYKGTLIINGGFNGADWFPYDFGKEHENGDSTLNGNLNTYKGFWWEVRE